MYKAFQKSVEDFCLQLKEIENSIDGGRSSPKQCLTELTTAIQESCCACSAVGQQQGIDLDILRSEFRHAIQPWFSKSWFMNRAFEKPRGYPCDFEILEGIYDNHAKSLGIGEALDLYFLHDSVARAVRGRKDRCKEAIKRSIATANGERVRVLNIACGPCREIRELSAEEVNRHLSFMGIDHDETALLYARNTLCASGISHAILSFSNLNVFRMTSAPKNVKMFGFFDLIYSIGLYDYLPDKALIRILRGTGAMLRNSAHYIVAFKDRERYDKTQYQWHVDWHFLQRTEGEIRSFVEQSGLTVTKAERDPSGIIVFLTLRKG